MVSRRERWIVTDALATLPYVDEHSVVIDEDRTATWHALLQMVESAAPSRFARLLGCVDTEASGPRPLAPGSAVPGFHVVEAERPERLVLVGSHRYSTYGLVFRLDDLGGGGGTRLRAETRAVFPGLPGGLYRAVLMGARAHAVATRRMLARVRRDAELRG